jgi:hypothetical protein
MDIKDLDVRTILDKLGSNALLLLKIFMILDQPLFRSRKLGAPLATPHADLQRFVSTEGVEDHFHRTSISCKP